MARRPYGTGSIIERGGMYYGKWRQDDRQVMRLIGPIRQPGTRDGLTKGMAEVRLRDLISEEAPAPIHERLTVEEVGTRFVTHLTTLGRKKSTTQGYESVIRTHFAPYFTTAVSRITAEDVDAFAAHLIRKKKLSIKSTRNYLGQLHAICSFAVKKGWATCNPVDEIELPEKKSSHDLRFLDRDELAAVVRKAAGDELGQVERVMWLTAAMTGLRQGELLGLRWMDIDWTARKVRVRQSYVRGEFGTPKSELSSRSVPLADSVAAELERLFQRSRFQGDADLVFGDPTSGDPMDRTKVLKRFKAAVKRAGLGRPIRFHDLRHTFGTHIAASGKVSLRTLQEWMGHRDIKTTQIYTAYAPDSGEANAVEDAFAVKKREVAGDGDGPTTSPTDPEYEPASD